LCIHGNGSEHVKIFNAFNRLEEECERMIQHVLPFYKIDLHVGFRYLELLLKPNVYGIKDQNFLVDKIDKRASLW
jgi:hypothetical protein